MGGPPRPIHDAGASQPASHARRLDASKPLTSDLGVVGAIGVTAIAMVPFVAAVVSAVTGHHSSIPGQAASVTAGLVAAALAWRAAARWTGRADVAHAWRAAALGVATWSGALGLWWAARTTGVISAPIDTAATAASIAFYPLAAAGLALLAERGRTESERLRFAVDAISVGVAAFVGLLVLRGIAPGAGPTTLLTVACTGGTAVVAAAAAGAMLHRSAGERAVPATLLGAGALVLAFAVPGLATLPADAIAALDGAGTLLGVVGAALVAWAAASQTVDRRTLRRAAGPTDRLNVIAGFLPIVAAAAAFAAILASEAAHLAPATIALVGCGVALVALAGLRQAVAVRESRDARRNTALVASQARFRSVVQNASDVIVTIGPSGGSRAPHRRSRGSPGGRRRSRWGWHSWTGCTATTGSGWPGSWTAADPAGPSRRSSSSGCSGPTTSGWTSRPRWWTCATTRASARTS